MPKMKTKSSAKKRFKLTGTGKIKRKHAFKSHIFVKNTLIATYNDLDSVKKHFEKHSRFNWYFIVQYIVITLKNKDLH